MSAGIYVNVNKKNAFQETSLFYQKKRIINIALLGGQTQKY